MDPSLLISLASLGLNLVIAVVLIVVSFRRRDPIDETLQDYATEAQLERTRIELRGELRTCQEEHRIKCQLEHQRVNCSLGELYNENKTLLEKITTKFDLLRDSLSCWQQGIERQLGNIEGRVKNLENKERN